MRQMKNNEERKGRGKRRRGTKTQETNARKKKENMKGIKETRLDEEKSK